ncbi:MAG: TonB-dependent receptor, partial [Brevundimonas sp.]
MQRSILLSTAAMAAAFAAPAFAREPDALDEVVVTATRIPSIVADTPGARVIDSAAIEQRGAVFAADILTDVPGLSVTRSGAFGGVAQVRLRGATPGKTLVLVDGAPVNDAAEPNGAYDFSGFDLGDVERIEVLSGPQSSLWGSDAIGGVIAFTTREIDGLRAEAEAGSFDTLRGRLAVGTANETWALGGYVSRFTTDGISVADEANGNPEADGFDNTTVGVRGRYAVSPAVTLDG